MLTLLRPKKKALICLHLDDAVLSSSWWNWKYMQPPCDLHVKSTLSCFSRSVSCKGSPPCGFRAVYATHDAKWSHIKLTAHWMREKAKEECENGNRCVMLFPAALTPAFLACPTAEPSHSWQIGPVRGKCGQQACTLSNFWCPLTIKYIYMLDQAIRKSMFAWNTAASHLC